MSDDTTQELREEIYNCTDLLAFSSKLDPREVKALIKSIVDCELELKARSNE